MFISAYPHWLKVGACASAGFSMDDDECPPEPADGMDHEDSEFNEEMPALIDYASSSGPESFADYTSDDDYDTAGRYALDLHPGQLELCFPWHTRIAVLFFFKSAFSSQHKQVTPDCCFLLVRFMSG